MTSPSARLFRRDVASAVLGFAPRVALSSLLPFIAVNRLGASMAWVGAMNAAIYSGFLWNAFFSTLTARASLQRSIVALMAGSAALLAVAAFQRSAAVYGAIVLIVLFAGGLMNAQYDTLLVHLYDERERPRRLSFRWMVVSVGAALLAPALGRLSEGPAGHWPALVAASAVLASGSVVFASIPEQGSHHMAPFRLRELASLVTRDRRLLRIVVALVLYGWYGAGFGTICVALYRSFGLGELAVGLLSGANTAGMVLASVAITPFLRFRGGLSNFRLCFTAATASALALMVGGLVEVGPLGLSFVALGNFLFGVGATGFTIAAQTTAANLAGAGNVALYVNAFKFFQGVRGMVFPLLVAWALGVLPAAVSFPIALGLTAVCALGAWLPRADGES